MSAEPVPFDKRRNLPANTADLQWKSLRQRTINDYVQDVFVKLYNDSERFRLLLVATGNDEAIEGLMIADDIEASHMIRDAAPDGSPLKTKNLAAIRRALGVVMRRAGIGRNERRNLLNGEIVA